MLLLWKIRYFDTRDKEFKDRDLYLDTDTLDAATRVAVEMCDELRDIHRGKDMLQYRALFQEVADPTSYFKDLHTRHTKIGSVFIMDYFEDENAKPITMKQIAALKTGNPNVIVIPPGAKQHDVDYMLADKRPIPLEEVCLSEADVTVLSYFARDLREISASAFYRDGPGVLHSGGQRVSLQTAATDEEIRSFVTIFRRLYMENEPANFVKAVAVFARVTDGYPLGAWIKGVGAEYERELNDNPGFIPFAKREDWPFSRKRIIDVFLYTQYAHQPDGRRTRQFQECLAAVGNERPRLTWLFLTVLWECALHMHSAGAIIADFIDRYCAVHHVSPGILSSVAADNPGIGTLEKKQDRKERVFREKIAQLAHSIWVDRGRPAGGPTQFHEQAREELEKSLGHGGDANAAGEAL